MSETSDSDGRQPQNTTSRHRRALAARRRLTPVPGRSVPRPQLPLGAASRAANDPVLTSAIEACVTRLLDERLSSARLAELVARAAENAFPPPVDPESAVIEGKVADLAASIESAATNRAMEAIRPTVDRIVSENLKSIDSRLKVRLAGGGGRPDSAHDLPALDLKLARLEEKLLKLVESRTLLTSERLDEHLSRKVEILLKNREIEPARSSRGSGPHAAPPKTTQLPQDPTFVAREVARVLPLKLSEVAANIAAGAEAQSRATLDRSSRLIDERAQKIASDVIQAFDSFEKRFTQKVEAFVSDRVERRVTEARIEAADLAEGVARSEELKAALDHRFRAMLQHLESDVLPRLMKTS